MSNTEQFPSDSPWHGPWLSPLNLAAYITWLAVLLQSLRWDRLAAGETRQWAGLGALAAVLAVYVVCSLWVRERHPTRERWLVLLQAAFVLLASWYLRHGGPAILMIVVAAQVVSLWPRTMGLLIMAACNLALLAIWTQGIGWSDALLSLFPMIGFQMFAALTVHYAMTAEIAHEQLARTHAQLLVTQQLLEDSARSGERLRLSRELHDVAGHKLTALKLNLRLLQRDPALADREEVQVSATLAEELLADIRAVVSELRKHDGIDLPAAITTLTRQIPGTRFRLEIDPALRVADVESAEILLRCAQEGITNALRHGRANEIEVRCGRVGERIELAVRNDGAALKSINFGNGLRGMRERLAEAGGELSLTALSGGGALLKAELPAHG
jgi:signal transduction histidine kinase